MKTGSLVRRVVIVFLLLVILPLLFYSFVVWDRDWNLKLNAGFSRLKEKAASEKIFFQKWVKIREGELKSFSFLMADECDCSAKLVQLKGTAGLSTLFIFDENCRCIASSKEAMIDMCYFSTQILERVYREGLLLFYTQKEGMFLLKRLGNQIWGMSIDAKELNPLIFVEKGAPAEANLEVFTLEDLQKEGKKMAGLEIHRLKGRDLALRLPLENALFDLQTKISSQEIEKLENVPFFTHLLIALGIFVILGGLGASWLVSRIARPFSQLNQVMHDVERKNYQVRYKKDRFGFEINALGKNFNHMLETLLQNMEEVKNQRVAREILEKELAIGHRIQNELFPKEIPQFPGVSVGVGFVPAKEIAGDFYELFAKDENTLFLGVADGSDKGVSACLYSLIVRSMLRCHAMREKSLSDVIRLTNNLFCKDTADSGNFVTGWLGFYQPGERLLTYSDAGHLPAVLIHADGSLEELTTPGIALGAAVIDHVVTNEATLSPGSLLFLYTDGIIEAHNEKGELFGKSRLYKFLQTNHTLSSQEIIEKLFAEIQQFSKEKPQHDDLTVLSIKA